MKKLTDGMNDFISVLKNDNNFAANAYRVAKVHTLWQNAVEAVYKDAAQMVLNHINAVYIMSATDVDDIKAAYRVVNGGTVLVVYADDSLIRSDLDARQEFLKMKINEQGEHVESFCIKPSRFDMKSRHPFYLSSDDLLYKQKQKTNENILLKPLSDELYNSINQRVSKVKHAGVRQVLQKAITSDLQYKIAKNTKNNK